MNLPLTGGIGPGRTLEGTAIFAQDHPANPFRHKYHPDHRKGRTVTRNFVMAFNAQQDTDDPQAGLSSLGGSFQETLTGLHKIPLRVSGTFTLQRVSVIDRLNDQ